MILPEVATSHKVALLAGWGGEWGGGSGEGGGGGAWWGGESPISRRKSFRRAKRTSSIVYGPF